MIAPDCGRKRSEYRIPKSSSASSNRSSTTTTKLLCYGAKNNRLTVQRQAQTRTRHVQVINSRLKGGERHFINSLVQRFGDLVLVPSARCPEDEHLNVGHTRLWYFRVRIPNTKMERNRNTCLHRFVVHTLYLQASMS